MDMLDFKISINKYYDRIDAVIFYILIFFTILLLFEIIPLLIVLLWLFFCLFGTFFFYFKKIKQKFKILSVKENHLIIGNNPPIGIDYMEIQNITLKYGAVKQTNWLGGVTTLIAIPDTGQENFIKITTKDGKKIVRNIWCENDADYWRLRSLGYFFEKRGIDVKMKGFERGYD